MNQRLTVQVEADIKNLERNLQRGEKSVDRFGKGVNKGEQQVGKFAKTTEVNAVPAMTSFSQVIQDAPYGIRGVANNITQLTSQFGYLSKSTGGAVGALKALGSSMLGPAGILFAVSAITSLMVTYADKLEFATNETEKLADATEKYIGEANQEISKLRTLIKLAQDQNANIQSRREAIEQLNKKYGDYLGNLDLESIKTDKVRIAVDNLTKSLIYQAQIKGIEDRIGKITEKSAYGLSLLKSEQITAWKGIQKQMDGLKDHPYWGRLIDDSKDARENLNSLIALYPKLDEQGLEGLRGAYGLLIKANKEYKEEVKSVADEMAPLEGIQTALMNETYKMKVAPEFDQEEIVINSGKKPEVKVQPTVDSAAIAELNRKIKEAQAEGAFLDQELSMTMPTENAIGEAGYANNLNESWLTLETQFDEHKDRMGEKMTEYNAVMNEEAMMLSSIFSQMSNQIIDGLLSGEMSVESFVKSSIKALGSLLVNMAQQAIAEKLIGKAQIATDQGVAMGNAAVIASNAAAALGPYGVVAYPGLLASQLAITSGAFAGIQAFNDGGIVGGGMVTGDKVLARMNSGEMVLKNSQQRNLFRMLDGAHLGGGSEPLEIYGETITRGDDLVTVLRRTEKKNSRIN